MKAEKLVETKEENDYITRKYHIIKDISDVDEQTLIELCERYEDDYETAYSYGISFTFDEDLFCVEVNPFIEKLEEEIEDEEDEFISNMIKKLEKYRGYTIYF